MYLSHPVRRMREDPIVGETATLVIELADSDADARETVEEFVTGQGGSVERELRFADLAVRLPEEAVASLCDLPGIERVETTDTLSQAPPGAEE